MLGVRGREEGEEGWMEAREGMRPWGKASTFGCGPKHCLVINQFLSEDDTGGL